VTHVCNPSYSGGRDYEEHNLKPAQGTSYVRPYLKNPITKKGLVEWLKVKALSSSPSTSKKKKIRNDREFQNLKTSNLAK
jgi:hypothetical protein